MMKTIRKRRDMTQQEVSGAIKCHGSYWYQYEHGARRPSLTLISRMRRHIDLTDDEILGLVGAVMADEDALEAKKDDKTDKKVEIGPPKTLRERIMAARGLTT